jgi:hypothetical protein
MRNHASKNLVSQLKVLKRLRVLPTVTLEADSKLLNVRAE